MSSQSEYTFNRIRHWNSVARRFGPRSAPGSTYHRRLAGIYSNMILPGSSVLEIGCGTGDLLAALGTGPSVGLDFSPEMLSVARDNHRHCEFIQADAHDYSLNRTFDYVILSDLINDLWDVQTVLEVARLHSHPKTRLLINFFSHLWQLPLGVARRLGVAQPNLEQNWLQPAEVVNMLYQAGFETLRAFSEFLFPFPFPLVEPFFNKFLVRFWPFNHLALTNVLVARPAPDCSSINPSPSVSVVIPARNESGNIPDIFNRMPAMGSFTELVFVEGHSRDDTFQAILDNIASHPEQKCLVEKQVGVGKGDAVRAGFAAASGDVLMILDADLTVPPEDLPRFYGCLVSGKGEFINGVRLVYPMQKQAMRFLNLLGNKFFSLAFSWLLGQHIGDTLCGTKALWRSDYERIAANRSYFGDFDPFGDYDLLFGAAHMNLKILDVPIRYHDRTYGTTNIQRWKHGWLLFRMVLFAARRIKFV